MTEVQPKLIIHGGAGSSLKGKGGLEVVRQSLHSIVKEIYDSLLQGTSATDAVIQGCQLLEDNPRFNAGTGSVLQSDGQIRMSASLMDGSVQRFSGVINVSRVKNPIQLAQALQKSSIAFSPIWVRPNYCENLSFLSTIHLPICACKNGFKKEKITLGKRWQESSPNKR